MSEENKTEEQQETKETVTEVTTIAQEEEKTGQTIPVPSPQELIARASASILSDRKHLAAALPKLGKKALQRVILAALELPTAGIPVKLISKEEKGAYLLAQRIINNRFTVTYYHILEESKKLKAKKEEEEKQKENKDEEVL